MTDRPGDPADKATDAKADGAFGGVTNHRAGYGDDKLARLIDYLRRQPRATLASGEGAVLLAEIDRLRDDVQKQADWADWAKGEIDRRRDDLHTQDGWVQWANGEMERLRNQFHLADQSARSSSAEAARLGRVLAALREPSEAVLVAAHKAYVKQPDPTTSAIRAAVAAAEQEVGRE